ncbi:2-C-methyl-D-erythritol 4-phosphate cytidylyltransferase [Methylothermus subterraneus]
MTRYFAVVPAAGSGRRMGAQVPKQYLLLAGKPVLERALESLLQVEKIEKVVVALAPADPYWPKLTLASHPKLATTVGGQERAHSVRNGLHALAGIAQAQDFVLVHDAARPCLRPADVERLIAALAEDPVGGILALPSVDTLKYVEAGRISATLDRSRVFRALTPQMFRFGLLVDALQAALAAGVAVTDEAQAVERAGYAPRIVEGSDYNLKITRPEDLKLAEFFLEQSK